MATYIKPEAIKDSSLPIEKIDNVALNLADKVNALDDSNKALFLNKINAMPATPSGDPMHYAYVAAGAEYNDTGADIVKNAPWADMADDEADKTVVHKAGYWYLNGIGDIDNNEMRKIYNGSIYFLSANTGVEALRGMKFRTNINMYGDRGGYSPISVYAMIINSNIEVLTFKLRIYISNIAYFCTNKVKYIIGMMDLYNTVNSKGAFSKADNLKGVKLNRVTLDISFAESPLLSLKSVLYMINNEAATSPITITLHADAYARAMANEEILAALETHTNVSLASA